MQTATHPVHTAALLALDGHQGEAIADTLRAAREHLGMDVALISEFRDNGTRVLRHVDARDAFQCPFEEGTVLPLAEGYCLHMIEGKLPWLIPDTSLVPAAMALPATRAIPIGAYLGVPIPRADGSVHGTFCCFSFQPHPQLRQRDLDMLRALAERVGRQLDRETH